MKCFAELFFFIFTFQLSFSRLFGLLHRPAPLWWQNLLFTRTKTAEISGPVCGLSKDRGFTYRRLVSASRPAPLFRGGHTLPHTRRSNQLPRKKATPQTGESAPKIGHRHWTENETPPSRAEGGFAARGCPLSCKWPRRLPMSRGSMGQTQRELAGSQSSRRVKDYLYEMGWKAPDLSCTAHWLLANCDQTWSEDRHLGEHMTNVDNFGLPIFCLDLLRNTWVDTARRCERKQAIAVFLFFFFCFSFRIEGLSSKLLVSKIVIWGTNLSDKIWCSH